MMLKSKRGRVRSGHKVIYWFLTLLQICYWHSEEKWEQLFFGDKIPHLESVFGNWAAFQCCGPSLEYCVWVWCKLIRKWPRKTPISVTRYIYCKHQYTHVQYSQIFVRNRVFCLPHLHSTPSLGGFPSEYCTSFGMEKLEWCGYLMVKKFRRYVYLFRHDPQMWRTDRQTDTACRHRPRLIMHRLIMHRIARQKFTTVPLIYK